MRERAIERERQRLRQRRKRGHKRRRPLSVFTHMMDGQHQEGPSSCTFSDDCQETWIDSTEAVVLDVACDRHAVVAVLLGGGLSKHVAKFGAAVLRTPCHLSEREKKEAVMNTVMKTELSFLVTNILQSSKGLYESGG